MAGRGHGVEVNTDPSASPIVPAGPDAARPRVVTIVLPAKDEERAVGALLRRLPRTTLRMMGLETEVFVLDGRSRDATCAIARRHGAEVVTDPVPGKGAALCHARHLFRGEFVVMLDADGTYPADAIPRLLAPLLRGEADVAMGTRKAQKDAMSGVHRLGNALLSMTARLLYNRPCPDVCTGMWAFRRSVLTAIPLRARGFELEAELFSLAARLDHRIASVPIDYLPRVGASKLSTWHGIGIGWHLVRMRFTSLPSRHLARPVAGVRPRPDLRPVEVDA